MISILLPTRKRPNFLERFVTSVREMSKSQPEIVVYIDDDDVSSAEKIEVLGEKGLVDTIIVGPRIVMTDYWNKCYQSSSGDIVMQAGDDIIMRTQDWDVMVEEAFAECPDKILLVHGNDLDGNFRPGFGSHCLVHRKWVETIGYFIPPYFSSDNGDHWIMEVAKFIGRIKALPFVTEHLHFRTGKAVMDSTYSERLARHKRDNPDQLYNDMFMERFADAEKLQTVISEYAKSQKDSVHA